MRLNPPIRFFLLLGAGLLVAGCGSVFKQKPAPPCPPIFVLKDAGSLTRYKPGAGRDVIDVLFRGRIIDFQAVCDFDLKRNEVEINLELAFELSRGPANRDRKAAFRYFVAIPQFYPAKQGRNTFSIDAAFGERETRTRTNDRIEMVIPLDPKIRLEKYAIYIGFQLTRAELEDNRRVTRF